MNIGSVGSSNTYQPMQMMNEGSEVKSAPDNDGDSDDGGAKVAPTPTVNTSGQTVGQLINAIA